MEVQFKMKEKQEEEKTETINARVNSFKVKEKKPDKKEEYEKEQEQMKSKVSQEFSEFAEKYWGCYETGNFITNDRKSLHDPAIFYMEACNLMFAIYNEVREMKEIMKQELQNNE